MYAEALAAFEASALGQAARGAFWLYPAANLAHVLGAALLVGAIAVFDIGVLSGKRGSPGSSRIALSVAACGLALQIPSGLVLLSAEASAVGMNPAFLFKAAMIALGLANLLVFHARFGTRLNDADPLPGAARVSALASLCVWALVLLAGRAIAYL